MKNNDNIIFFIPSIEGGGVEKNLFIIANYLGKKFSHTKLITCDRIYNPKFKQIKVINPKAKVEKFSLRRLKYFFCFIELIKIILNDKNNIVFAFQANLYCSIICKILGIKVIIRSNSSPSGWKLGFFRKIIFKIFLKLPNKIIVNSKEFQIEYRKKFNLKTSCIYNPLNKDHILKLSSEKIKNNFFKNYKYLKIIFIGRLVDQKDPMTFIKAIDSMKKINFRALIIGKGVLSNNIKNFINTQNLQKKVKIINWQKNPYKFIRSSDVLVLTSKFEGLPNILLEGICLKKFVISSNCPTGPKEILNNGKGGFLFEVGDYEGLRNKLYLYSQKKRKLNNKINFAYKNLSRFDYKRNLNLYYQEIRGILFEK